MFLDPANRDDRALEEVVEKPQPVVAAGERRDLSSVMLPERQDRPGRIRRGAAYLVDSAQEEPEPTFPIALGADRSQAIVVLGSVGLQVEAEVEERSCEYASLAEEERDEEPPHASVAVEEGVDGLELSVRQAAVHQGGEPVSVVEEPLEGVKGLAHLVGWRWNEMGLVEAAPGRADPILGAPELARVVVPTSYSLKQLAMNLAE